jgi:hypothetical protein
LGLQFALDGDRGPVVGRILVEGMELLEAGVRGVTFFDPPRRSGCIAGTVDT